MEIAGASRVQELRGRELPSLSTGRAANLPMNCSSKVFFGRTAFRVRVATALLAVACCAGLKGNLHAADVVYVSRSDTPSTVRRATDTASKFYGLRMIEVAADGSER